MRLSNAVYAFPTNQASVNFVEWNYGQTSKQKYRQEGAGA